MSTLQESSPKSEAVDGSRPKKKKRSLGHFPCPDCGKIFTRTDHLSRHHLNHQPKELFECEFVLDVLGGGRRKCGKSFVRKDLCDRHIKRHVSTSRNSRVNWSSVSSGSSEKGSPDTKFKSVTPSLKGYTPGDSPLQISNLVHAVESNDRNGFPDQSPDVSINVAKTQVQVGVNQVNPLNPVSQVHVNQVGPELIEKKYEDHKAPNVMQTQNELISWLFNDSSPPNVLSPMNEPIRGFSNQASPRFPNQIIDQDYNFPNDNVRHYDLAESNVFQSDLNPLDEALIRSYSQIMPIYPESENHINNDHFKPTFNFNIPSTISLTSPTDTSESNTTPLSTNDVFSPSTASTIQKKINEYGTKFNTPFNSHIYVDKSLLHQLFMALPSLQRNFVESIFNDKVLIEDRFSYYLSVYWLVFHPQFNFLHKPSFKTVETEPLLLLSMIIIGCNYCTSPDHPETLSSVRSKSSEYKLALAIATPLRFQIFQNDGFKSPVKLWVLQSLNLLEWSEKNFLSRTMHERAHIHHGTTVQLMRRSPALGGNPAIPNKGESDDEVEAGDKKDIDSNDCELFKKWVESESMKRITFMTFYLDIADYVKFRHNPVIEFHQLQLLKLPCDDDLWEAYEVNGSFSKVMKKQKKVNNRLNPNETFLNILKKLMKTNQKLDMKISSFVKKILFGGLLSIMYQMQQLEVSNSLSIVSAPSHIAGGSFDAWKESLSTSIDNFSLALGQSCKHIDRRSETSKIIRGGISTCKFSLYHLAHIVGLCDLNTYDISIYCGMPANQNVNIGLKDILVVERKFQKMWVKQKPKFSATDIVNLKSIIHCYLFLWETLLDEEDGSSQSNSWEPDKDYYDGMFAMSLVMQVLWSYCYVTSGTESNRYSEIEDKAQELSYDKMGELSAETAYDYLIRIRQEFVTYLRRDNYHNSHSIKKLYQLDQLSHTPDEIIVKYCHILSSISNKQNISGLCFLVGNKLHNSQWELVRENGRLIMNCGFKSIGKKELLCKDVFDTVLLD